MKNNFYSFNTQNLFVTSNTFDILKQIMYHIFFQLNLRDVFTCLLCIKLTGAGKNYLKRGRNEPCNKYLIGRIRVQTVEIASHVDGGRAWTFDVYL